MTAGWKFAESEDHPVIETLDQVKTMVRASVDGIRTLRRMYPGTKDEELYRQAGETCPLTRTQAIASLMAAEFILADTFTPSPPLAGSVIFLLWSNKHQSWWREGARGYTRNIGEAGRYSEADALHYVRASAMCGIREQVTCMVAAPDNWERNRG